MIVLVNGYIGKKITGIGRALVETLKAAAAKDLNTRFIVYTNFDMKSELEAALPPAIMVKAYGVTKNSSLKNLIFNALIFPWFGILEKADVVYFPNFTPIFFSFRPVVTVIHDLIEFRIPAKFSKIRVWYRHQIVPMAAKASRAIITVSENSKLDIVEFLAVKPEIIHVVMNGVTRLVDDSRRPSDPEAVPIILYVGTIDHPGKNVYTLVCAFDLLRAKGVKARLVFCGMPGKGHEVVFDRIEKSPFLADIQREGFISDSRLKEWYSSARVFAFLSLYEGFGLPILEAMNAGLPVITSNRSSLPEIAGKAAMIVDPTNIEEVADALTRCLQDEELREKLIHEGVENLKRFSWAKAGEETLRILKSAAER